MTRRTRLSLYGFLLVASTGCDPLGTCLEKAQGTHPKEDLLILNTKKSSCANGEFTKEDANAGFLRGRTMGFSPKDADKNKSIDDVVKNHDVLILERPTK